MTVTHPDGSTSPPAATRFSGYLALPEGRQGPGRHHHPGNLRREFAHPRRRRSVRRRWLRRARAGHFLAHRSRAWNWTMTARIARKASSCCRRLERRRRPSPMSARPPPHCARLPEVTGKVAAIGYCFGGRLAYLAAAQGTFDVAVAYYGGGIQNQLDQADKIKVPMQFHYGELDAHIPAVRSRSGEASASRPQRRSRSTSTRTPITASIARIAHRTISAASALAHGRTLTFLGEHS